MRDLQLSENFSIGAKDYANSGNTMLGIRGSGKTYTATKAAEELMFAGIPIIAFDPTNVWQNLRFGVSGPGYPIVLADAYNGDLLLNEDNATDLVEAAVKENISIIFGLQGMSKSKMFRIVAKVTEWLLANNLQYGLRHIFIEEAAEFVPQRPYPGGQICYGQLATMARIGRNFGLGYTLINQRPEEISKEVFEICERVFVHRVAGKNSLKSMKSWLELRSQPNSGLVESLPTLEAGECWVIDNRVEIKIQVKAKTTFHPDPKNNTTIAPQKSKADIGEFIAKLQKSIQGVPAKVPGGTMKATGGKGAFRKTPVNQDITFDEEWETVEQLREEARKDKEEIVYWKKQYQNLADLVQTAYFGIVKESFPGILEHAKAEPLIISPSVVKAPKEIVQVSNSKNGASRMLAAAAMFHPKEITKQRMATISGLSITSSTFRIYLAQLVKSDQVIKSGDMISITEKGLTAVSDVPKMPPEPKQLLDLWCGIIGANSGATRILRFLFDHAGNNLSKESVAAGADLASTSSTFRIYLANLRKNGLIVVSGSQVRISPEFFD